MRRLLTLLGLLAVATPAAAVAQTGYTIRLYFSELEGGLDTAYAALAGGDVSLTVRGQDPYFPSYAIGAFTLRIYFDPARVSFVTARSSCPDSVTNPLNAPVTGPNYVELSANGCGISQVYDHTVATVRLHLAAGATDGSSLYLEPVAVNDRLATNRTADAVGDVDELCLALGIWGDVDADGLVNSRDALIALSNAVGLPTPGFLISRGDVDGDGYVGSRDALGMLSASIGYPPASGFRTGRGIVSACAPQILLPRTLYYVRQGPNPGVPGVSGLVVRAANDSTASIVGDSADAGPSVDYRPRVSPNGAQVVFVCYWQFYLDVCRANADGTGLVNLTAGAFSTHMSPDWSPTGDSLVFVRNNQIWVMAPDGSNPHVIPSTPSIFSVAWAPVPGSRRIAYVTTADQVRSRDLDSAGTTDSLVFAAATYANTFRSVDWSPAADSLVFAVRINGGFGTYAIARSGGTPARIARVPGPGFTPDTRPTWTDQGVFVTGYDSYPSPARNRLLLLRPNGTIVRIGRDPTGNFAAGMDKQ